MATGQNQIGQHSATSATRWSLIIAAGDPESPHRARALTELCETYWYTVYAYIRRGGRNETDAEDLTQGFFATLLDKNYLGDADRERGRFRTFLRAAVRHYLANEHDRASAQKRGGGRKVLSIDFVAAEERYRLEPTDKLTPDLLFERRWAMTVLERAMDNLQQRYQRKGRGELLELLKPYVAGEGSETYSTIAERLAISVESVRQQVSRLRGRCRKLIRAEIADTVTDPTEIDDELRRLMQALSS